MFQKITGTILTRFLTLAGAFGIVVLNTNTLGDVGQGTIALISFTIMCVMALINYIGGGAVVYLTPRLGIKKLIVPAYLWAALVSILVYLGMLLLDFKSIYKLEIAVLAFLHGLFTFHMQLLIGKERIRAYNVLQIIQVFSLLILLFCFYKILNEPTVESFVRSLLFSFILVYIVSLFLVIRYFKEIEIKDLKTTFLKILKYNKFAQTANVMQILNYRLNFVLIERLILNSRGIVGIYSVGMYMSEAVWNVSKSISMVQYSRISNEDDEEYNTQLTNNFFKISTFLTAIILLIILILPEGFYTGIFGDRFIGVKSVLLYISPGVLLNSGSVIISHYYSGIGQYKVNAISSGLGLVGTVIAGIIFIGPLGLKGASITFSIAMGIQFLYLFFCYLKEDGNKARHMILKWSDIRLIKNRYF